MKDWKQIASGLDLPIPDADLDRIVPVLNALDAAFRPLTKSIPADLEPAIIFTAETHE